MRLRWILFETMAGELFLRWLERRAGLAIVQADWLCMQQSGRPVTAKEPR